MFEFFAEFLLEALIELGCGLIGAWWQGGRGALGVPLLGLLGAGVGGASLWAFPEPVIHSFPLSAVNVAVLPFVAGALVAIFRKASAERRRFEFDLERFGAAFTVVLTIGLARFVGLVATGAL